MGMGTGMAKQQHRQFCAFRCLIHLQRLSSDVLTTFITAITSAARGEATSQSSIPS